MEGIAPQEVKPDAPLENWQAWLRRHFSDVCTAPFAPRHIRLWEWEEALVPGIRPKAFLAIWPRGGGKSTTVELICARVCDRESRHFMLIVSDTQDQANKRIVAISELLGTLGITRAVNQYGTSQGWKTDLLRASNGFNVAGYGLKEGVRGIKLGTYRPDIIVLDDIDGLTDSLETTQKKIDTITDTLINAGSNDCAYLYVQNRIKEFGVMSRLVDGTAEFLLDREPVSEEPAVLGLEVQPEEQEDGRRIYRIVGGVPTWEGQSLAQCEQYINASGLKSFKREMQHEVAGADGVFFKVSELRTIAPEDVPPLTSVCLAGDLAATEGGGDYTVLFLLGRAANKTYYVLSVLRGQWASERVRAVIDSAVGYYKPLFPNIWHLHLPQDPGQAGKDQKTQLAKRYAGALANIESVSGKKATRATGLQEAVNVGNVFLVEEDTPDCFAAYIEHRAWFSWHLTLREEFRKFREDEKHEHDDIVDAGADAFNEIAGKRTIKFS